jgi:hypothetical protein
MRIPTGQVGAAAAPPTPPPPHTAERTKSAGSGTATRERRVPILESALRASEKPENGHERPPRASLSPDKSFRHASGRGRAPSRPRLRQRWCRCRRTGAAAAAPLAAVSGQEAWTPLTCRASVPGGTSVLVALHRNANNARRFPKCRDAFLSRHCRGPSRRPSTVAKHPPVLRFAWQLSPRCEEKRHV